jgi:hypothetical protein
MTENYASISDLIVYNISTSTQISTYCIIDIKKVVFLVFNAISIDIFSRPTY